MSRAAWHKRFLDLGRWVLRETGGWEGMEKEVDGLICEMCALRSLGFGIGLECY